MFIYSCYSGGYMEWFKNLKEDKWFSNVYKFLTILEINCTTSYDIAIAILLIFPAIGPSSGKDPIKPLNRETKVFQKLGEEGMKIYKSTITDNNSVSLRDNFFNTPIIQEIWKHIMPKMSLKNFKVDKISQDTKCAITKTMKKRYGLQMCPDWEK